MPEPIPTSSVNSAATDGPENVWTHRGYRMRAGEFNTAMVHFYRGELQRSNTWRLRLDSTTNWAVITTGAVLTFAFGSVGNSHVVILISFLLVWLFLVIESRRYRYYELWTLRVRLLETDFFAAMLTPPFAPHPEWATRLADTLLTPEFPITQLEALGRRLRRNYIWIYLILGLAWVVKLMLHPTPVDTLERFFNRASIGFIGGHVVATGVACFFLGIFLVAILTAGLRAAAGEVLPQSEVLAMSNGLLQNLASAASHVLPEDLPFLSRQKHLAIIITSKPEEVSQQLLSFLNRGVTALDGKGMYTGQARTVLLCAIAPAEIAHLKALVYRVDEHAFVVVNPTEEIWGSGFSNLEPPWKRPLQSRKKSQSQTSPS
ncbi:MAG: DUF2270 domain-containing protein [Anaerolineae bacterium]|nr:DUF2270 domain-containing protein [Anaerolineae bacterium]